MFFGGYAPGQHVVAKKDLRGGWLGSARITKGQRGIVRATPGGFFDARYTVEFSGGLTYVNGRDLKLALFGGGEDSWRRYQQTRQGIALGMFLLTAVPLASWYLSGGTTAELIAAVPEAVFDLVGQIVGVLGLPIALFAGAVIWLRRRGRG